MDNLRFILIIVGILIIIAIYLWDRYQSKNDMERYRASLPEHDKHEEGLVITTKTPFDEDLAAELADLKNFMGDRSEAGEELDPFLAHESELEPEEIPGDEDSDDFYDGETGDDNRDSTMAGEPGQKDQIIILHLVANENTHIHGQDFESVLHKLGFKFGEMDIYHLQTQSGTVLSLVNMFEPGYFEPDKMAEFSTRGVSLFANLKNDGSAGREFLSMLDLARNLAEELDCSINGPDRQALTESAIKTIQDKLNRRIPLQA